MLRGDQLTAAVTAVEVGYGTAPGDANAWVQAIATALQPVLDMGDGVLGWSYDARDLTALKFDHVARLNIDDRVLAGIATADLDPRNTVAIRKSHYRTAAGPFSWSLGKLYDAFEPAWREHLGVLGIRDMLVINAMNFGFRGCAFSAPSRKPLPHDDIRDALLARVASHLVCAYRLRVLTRQRDPEAVLEPGGRVAHADGPAKDATARASLQRAVSTMEIARGRMRRTEPAEALSIWSAMVEGRWTLVDQFESDGRRYIVAKPNQPSKKALSPLSARETQVVALASIGRANKVIAYELGLAEGTVATLLTRARRKLGASGFDTLLIKMSSTWTTKLAD